MHKPLPGPEDEAGVRQDKGPLGIRKIDLPRSPASGAKKADGEKNTLTDMDLNKIIPLVVKGIDQGKTVKQISARHKIPLGLTEEITRMYLTHPGIDTEGIRTRIEITGGGGK